MQNFWKIFLLIAALVFVVFGIHDVYSYFSIMAEYKDSFEPGNADDSAALFRLTEMRRSGFTHIGIGLLLLHQAVKFYLDTKKK